MHHVLVGSYQDICLNGPIGKLTEIKCDDEGYSSQQCHEHIMCSGVWDSSFITTAEVLLSNRKLGVEQVGDGPPPWPQTFSISLSISCVITGAFDGLFMTQAPLL